MSAKPLKVVLYWHMHQPEYRDRCTGQYHLPWTYLHVIKDYVDMAAHLEAHPEARAVVNFTPTLLEQIDDYAQQLKSYLDTGNLSDPLLAALAEPVLPNEPEQRLSLIKQCLRANEQRLIARYPHYQRLAGFAKWINTHPEALLYLHDQFLVDILMWFHLAWLGETVRRNDKRVKRLMDKGIAFNLHERRELLQVITELVDGVIGRYRRLAERGQIELSVTPYAHPIMPLLIDLHAAREAMPEVQLPGTEAYPDGEQRAIWHIRKGLEVFEHYFGFRPRGCWPAEGSISERTLSLLAEQGFDWLASGETVLRNSAHASSTELDPHCIHAAYHYNDSAIKCFFRDDGLSDLLGFEYAGWHGDDAVANLIRHLENIAQSCQHREHPVVSIIMDGENAWEYYPENGFYFLSALYSKLSAHPDIQLTTYSDYLAQDSSDSLRLDRVVAGSWVYGTFSTWIGDPEKNRAWELLVAAKQACDRQLAQAEFSDEQRQHIEAQLAICEGSDWFWWFGDYNPANTVSDFDHLFRLQLSNLYLLLGLEPPNVLAEPFAHGGGAPEAGGTMRHGQEPVA